MEEKIFAIFLIKRQTIYTWALCHGFSRKCTILWQWSVNWWKSPKIVVIALTLGTHKMILKIFYAKSNFLLNGIEEKVHHCVGIWWKKWWHKNGSISFESPKRSNGLEVSSTLALPTDYVETRFDEGSFILTPFVAKNINACTQVEKSFFGAKNE
jgi:hypothetical protein